MQNEENLIIYNTDDGKVAITLLSKDGKVWMNQKQLSELFDTSKQNISLHIANVLKDKELEEDSVVKYYLTTGNDGKIPCCCLCVRNDYGDRLNQKIILKNE